ncbi:MAG: hypothetical protein HN764_05410 [Gammaproteobacteria bacterium]|nr:hypothetical protein [Gammaproteobacteria bacterium]
MKAEGNRKIICRRQSGYTDMQVTPAMIGVMLIYIVMEQVISPEFDLDKDMLKLVVFLSVATVVLLYGFVMHLYALGFPESPFNKHNSSVFMTLLCAGSLAYVAYQFYELEMRMGFIVYAVLCLLVVGLNFGFGFYRGSKVDD